MKIIIDLELLKQCDQAKELTKELEQVVIRLDKATMNGKRISICWFDPIIPQELLND